MYIRRILHTEITDADKYVKKAEQTAAVSVLLGYIHDKDPNNAPHCGEHSRS